MPIDITLIAAVLRVLLNNAGRPAMTEELVGIDCEVIMRRPLIADNVRAALLECAAHAWAVESADEFARPLWTITEAGKLKARAR